MAKRDVALVQGPPGTGKTTVFESAVNAAVDKMSGGSTMVYMAPTNRLVAEMLEKVAYVYRLLGKSMSDIANEVRVYGSQFNFGMTYAKMNMAPDTQVKLVITTEYQRVFTTTATFHLMIDEASKSPLHAPFIALAEDLLSNRGNALASISVIGDPQQAITLNEEYRSPRGKNFLIMNAFLRGLLDDSMKKQVDKKEVSLLQASRDTLGKYFSFLETSRRMPHPTEVPISKGYYDGMLKSKFTAAEVMKDLWDPNIAAKVKDVNDDMKFVVGKLEEGLTTDIPAFYVKTSGFTYEHDDMSFDPFRGHAGVAFATGLAAITGKRTAVLTTYTDQWTQMKIDYRENFAHILKENARDPNLVSFGTVHRWLGAESDNIIAVLGKENPGTQEHHTIYFQEPELLNVQLSRHLKTLTIVGDLGKLIKTVNQVHMIEHETNYSNMKVTAEELINQAGLERIKENVRKVRPGDACVYAPWPDVKAE
jgi:AAA domain